MDGIGHDSSLSLQFFLEKLVRNVKRPAFWADQLVRDTSVMHVNSLMDKSILLIQPNLQRSGLTLQVLVALLPLTSGRLLWHGLRLALKPGLSA